MIGLHAQRSLWQLSAIATLGAALILQACSGRVQVDSDCRSGSSCGGGGAGGKAEAGSAAVAASGESMAGAGATPAACTNNRQDSNESDVDCGGPSHCARCATKYHCTAN